jgi:hypothetical protein
MMRTLLKSIDAELSRIPFGHTLGLFCEIQGLKGNRYLSARGGAGAAALNTNGYTHCASDLSVTAIGGLVGVLDALERQRDTGVADPRLAWAEPYLVNAPETVRLSMPPQPMPEPVNSSVQFLLSRLPGVVGVEVQNLGMTLYRNRATQNRRTISADWHFDRRPTDWLRMFVYLSEVDGDSGPFQFIDLSNSKRLTRAGFKRGSGEWQQRVQDDATTNKLLGLPGSALVINVERLLHRAGIPAPGRHRDMLEIIFKPRVN